MATDAAGKRAVSLAMSQHLSVSRAELAQRRQVMKMNYGDLFVAYELVKSGAKMDNLAAKIKMGKTVWQAADEEHVDWRQIANEAKKLSGRVDSNLIRYFVNQKAVAERDRAEAYDPSLDRVKADGDVSPQEIEDAQTRYLFLRDHVGAVSDSSLDTSTENAARTVRTDPVRTAGAIGANSSQN